MTEYTAPVESLKVTNSLSSYLHGCILKTALSVSVIFCLTWLLGTSRHKACTPVRCESTHPSKLVTPVHRMPLISTQLEEINFFLPGMFIILTIQ